MNYPPELKLLNYPATLAIVVEVVFVSILLVVAGKFDPTGGTLTISLMVVLAFISAVAFTMIFNIPNDEITAAIAGGLVAAFGAVIAYWLGGPRSPS